MREIRLDAPPPPEFRPCVFCSHGRDMHYANPPAACAFGDCLCRDFAEPILPYPLCNCIEGGDPDIKGPCPAEPPPEKVHAAWALIGCLVGIAALVLLFQLGCVPGGFGP